MLTKSLHTVTSCTAVALYLNGMADTSATPEQLAVRALGVLGYAVDPGEAASDTTVAACVKSVRKALAKVAA